MSLSVYQSTDKVLINLWDKIRDMSIMHTWVYFYMKSSCSWIVGLPDPLVIFFFKKQLVLMWDTTLRSTIGTTSVILLKPCFHFSQLYMKLHVKWTRRIKIHWNPCGLHNSFFIQLLFSAPIKITRKNLSNKALI